MGARKRYLVGDVGAYQMFILTPTKPGRWAAATESSIN